MGQGTVLIVDDNPDIRSTLELVPKDDGYDTIVAKDGQEALDLIPHLPELAVILLDLQMPKLDGAAVVRHLVAHPEMRDDRLINWLTANVSQLTADMTHLLGAEGIPMLPKPFDVDALLDQVRGAFARKEREQP